LPQDHNRHVTIHPIASVPVLLFAHHPHPLMLRVLHLLWSLLQCWPVPKHRSSCGFPLCWPHPFQTGVYSWSRERPSVLPLSAGSCCKPGCNSCALRNKGLWHSYAAPAGCAQMDVYLMYRLWTCSVLVGEGVTAAVRGCNWVVMFGGSSSSIAVAGGSAKCIFGYLCYCTHW
jgi:hypothetical protein